MITNKLLYLLIKLSFANVYAEGVADNFCSDFGNTLKLISISVLIVRIMVPLLIVIMGSLDIFNTVKSGKEDDLKKQLTILGKRVLIGMFVFFLPNLVSIVVNALDTTPSDYKVCIDCISSPSNCKTPNSK